MVTTQSQISSIFNLMVQLDPRLNFYHFGYRSDIEKEIDNNFNINHTKGRLFPAVNWVVPEFTRYVESVQYTGLKEEIEITLYFDALQDYFNNGSANTRNLIQQWDDLKKIAEDFIANFDIVFCSKYCAGSFSLPQFEQLSYGHNDRLISWKVQFTLTHFINCTDVANQIDLNLLPASIDDDDLENWKEHLPIPDRCSTLLASLSQDDLLNCILPTYDFSDVDTQNATTAQQQTDLIAWLCGPPPTGNFSFNFDGVNERIISNQKPNLLFQGDDPASVGAWIKLTSFDAAYSPVIAWFYEPTQRGFNFYIDTTGVIVFSFKEGFTSPSRWGFVAGTTIIPLNTWVHVSATKDSQFAWTNAKVYLNGVDDTATTFGSVVNDMTPSMTLTQPTIGSTGSTGAKFFEGNIFAPRIWTTELTPAQILNESNNKTYTSTNVTGLEWDADFNQSLFGAIDYAIPNNQTTSGNSQTQNMELVDLSVDVPT